MKTTLLLIVCLLIIPFTVKSQLYTTDIEAKFANKNDIDFVLASTGNGASSNMQYCVANDTLYEGVRKVALKDIGFDPIDIYKNVFNTINGSYPYVLTLKPKPNCFTFYYGTAVKGQIELYLPGEKYALETWTWLFKKSKTVNTNTNTNTNTTPAANSMSEATAKEICFNTLTFLNDIMKTNLAGYIGDPITSDPDFREYYSTVHFPNSIKTIIVDTNMWSTSYRKANIIFMQEWPDNNIISNTIIGKYKELAALLKICLDNNQFVYSNKDANPDVLYKYQSTYTKLQAPDPNAFLSSLQTQHGYIVQLVITQHQLNNGGYENALTLILEAQ